MKRVFLFILMCAGQTVWGQSLEWLTDARAAQGKAKEENKMVLLDFTGSDWCGWCIKLKREVFDQPEFVQYARSKLIMVEVDFPHQQTLSQAQQQANARLQRTYGVTGYPTIILLNQDGKQAGRMGYVSGGPAAFIARLEKVAGMKTPANQTPVDPEPAKPRTPVTWTPPPPAVSIHYGPLALKSVSGTKERRMVLINNATMMTGETAKVRTEDREVVVCCKEIREDSVTITCDGKPMELKLGGIK